MRIVLILVALIFANPASAITGKEVWQNWQMAGASHGWFVKQSHVTDLQHGIRVDDLLVSNDSGLVISLTGLTFADGANGEVKVAFGPKLEVLAPVTKTALLTVESQGAVLLFKDAARGFAIAADSVALISPDSANKAARFALDSVTGGITFGMPDGAKMIPIEASLHVGDIDYNISDISDPARVVLLDGKIHEVDFKGAAKMPVAMAGHDLAAEDAFKAGFGFDMTLTNGPMHAHVNSDARDLNATGLACKMTFTMDQGRFAFRDDCGDGELRLKGPDTATEAVLTLQKLLVQVSAPVNSMAKPSDVNFLVSLKDAKANDAVWAKVDPKNALPHDPMSVVLDMAMLARWNIFDDATTEGFKPEAVNLRQFDLNIAGMAASFSGHGITNPGNYAMPFGEGVLDGKVSGLNRLLNAIIDAGMVSSGDIFPVRAAMAIVFDPGASADVLTTHVETKQDGSIFVNGVQMK
ncbi:MAG: hypothetical protein ABIV25_08545 [Paracoccaceae bacterium]